MKFKVYNRDDIHHYEEDEKHILISIDDPYAKDEIKFPKNENRLDILQLKFHDWNERDREHIEKDFPSSRAAQKMVYFTKQDAENIVQFVKKYLDVDVIICQCEAGISRSAGCAAALSKCINGDDAHFFERYLPNTLVYKLILNEWMSYENKAVEIMRDYLLENYGDYRMGLTSEEIQRYLEARCHTEKKNIKDVYSLFNKIAGVNTMAVGPQGQCLMYRHDVKRFADELLLGKETYFD